MQALQLANGSGKFVTPTIPGFLEAAEQADWDNAKNMAATMLNMPGDSSWPIVSATYILVPRNPKDPARIQSVLQDPHTLTIGYDATRGEPRRGTEAHGGPIDLSGNTASMKGAGDCIDCGLCVAGCPQGIDIRMGFQLECISCARCIDACHSVMGQHTRAHWHMQG